MAVLRPDGWRQVGGWSLVAIALAALVSVPLSLSGGVMSRPGIVSEGPDFWIAFFVPGFVLSGGVLVHLRPRNPIGWLLVVSGLLQVTNLAADAYATRALTDPDGSLSFGLPLAWLASWTWMPSLLLPTLALPALYPTGRPPNRFWAWHVRLAMLGIGLGTVAMATGLGGVDDTVAGTELPWTAPVWASFALGVPAATLLLVTAVSATVGTLVRAIRAVWPERQQLLWLLSVVAGLLVTVWTGPELLFVLSYTFIPVAVTIGVLRYRLLGIEVVLRRTLLYVPLTLLVALVIGGLTTVLARLGPDGPIPLLVSSAAVAVLVIPVAGRLRVLVDRFVLGRPTDPLAAVDRVGAGLEVEHDDPTAAMLEAVSSAAGATYASVRDTDGQLLVQIGSLSIGVEDLPLLHGGVGLGTLSVGPRPGHARVSEADARLLAALAPHLAVVVRSQMLTRQLARERERVTTATLSERDRLRRDLHDGLGPSLSGIALGLQAASAALSADPPSVAPLLARTRSEAEAAVREVRRVLDGLRPGALDVNELPEAVRDTATSLGLGRPGGPTFELDVDRLPALAPQVEEAAFRIVAESLTNVARHARAGRCAVQLAQANGDLQVAITDDGCGAPPTTRGARGHGLESMRRRAADLGGVLRVEAATPDGTTVTALLPLWGAP
jgi:signal transduction histidine kinase